MAKILLVEDNPANVEIVTRFLTHGSNYQVVVAHDGTSGLLLAHQEMPDLIIMDMSLPDGLDGWEATRRLKADQATRAIPVLAFTAFTMPEDIARAKEAGCDDFHGKGASDLKLLIEKIERLLKR